MAEIFKEIKPEYVKENPIHLIGDRWMLITSGKMSSFNTMTASWGALGFLWNKPVAFCFVRPERYTFKFMEENTFFSLCFFSEKYRQALNICGTNSGKNFDKIKATKLTPIEGVTKTVIFKEADLVMELRKIYFTDIDKNNILEYDVLNNYEGSGFHRMYIGEILYCGIKSN
ncbi:MAG: flavin reductase [Brevinematales bacterium]|nr:flavin reductase [Brevinematales bacterium]